jgi:hypothetical protein
MTGRRDDRPEYQQLVNGLGVVIDDPVKRQILPIVPIEPIGIDSVDVAVDPERDRIYVLNQGNVGSGPPRRYTEDLIRERTARPARRFHQRVDPGDGCRWAAADPNRSSDDPVRPTAGRPRVNHSPAQQRCSTIARTPLHRWARVCREAGLIPNAIEEVLRFDSPVITWRRKTKVTVRIQDVDIPAEANLLLLIGSANRDASVFAAPESFDILRPNARHHLSFGMGNHFCLGAPLARLEARVVFEELTRRRPGLQLVTRQTLAFHPNIAFRGPTSLRVALR